jgi:transposase
MKRTTTLRKEQQEELLQRYKTEKNPHLRTRVHCLLFNGQGYTNRKAARILQTSEHSVNDWCDRYEEGGLDR